MRILPLTGDHDREGFDCGQESLNDWLRRIALQHQRKGVSKTFVAVLEGAPEEICGYFALTLTEVDTEGLPAERRARLQRIIPGVRLGRLAVASKYQGRRLGELMLMNAVERARLVGEHAGVVGLFVDALDEEAAGFYRHFGFDSFEDDPLKLFFPVR